MVTARRSAVRFAVTQIYGTLENWLQIPKVTLNARAVLDESWHR